MILSITYDIKASKGFSLAFNNKCSYNLHHSQFRFYLRNENQDHAFMVDYFVLFNTTFNVC